MRHIAVTTKKDQKVLIHVDDLKEAYPTADNKHTVCVIRVSDRDRAETFLIVTETTGQIYDQLRKLIYERALNGPIT